jgi:ABC-type transport system involved in multi-copper enzyme maturation permease subunit
LGAVLTFSTAVSSPQQLKGQEKFVTTVAGLAQPAAAFHGFLAVSSLIGLIVAVIAAATVGSDYSSGTLRPLLVRHPRRVSLLAGKLATFTAVMAVGLLLAELAGFIASLAYADVRGVSTSAWLSGSGLWAAMVAFGKALFICTAWQVFGASVAFLSRSLTVAVVIVVIWAVPVERIAGSASTAATHWLPGLLLEALSFGDTSRSTGSRVLVIVACYAVLLLVLAALDFRRRDVVC